MNSFDANLEIRGIPLLELGLIGFRKDGNFYRITKLGKGHLHEVFEEPQLCMKSYSVTVVTRRTQGINGLEVGGGNRGGTR